jgi:flagellar basal-body rod modification protein FlgD
MSSVASTGSTTDAAAALAALSQSKGASGTTAAADDPQSKFLRLLVAQLKNQDPLNPVDNAQMTSQMAQISTVTGIDKLNTTLQAMAASFSAGQTLQASSMIGRNVLVPGSDLQLQDGAAQGGVSLAQPVDKLIISVVDASAQVVHKVDLGPQAAGVVNFQWDGVTDNGATAAAGSYSFKVEAVQAGNRIDAAALALGRVTGVTQGTNGAMLNINGMAPVAVSDVKQVM